MAKNVVATLKTSSGKDFAKVIRTLRSKKTEANKFKKEIIPTDSDKEYF